MRKTAVITIDSPNRDQGKIFHLEEMDAWSAEEWATRVFFAIMNAGADIPDEVADMGFTGLFLLSSGALMKAAFKGLSMVPVERAKPILDDLMKCVKLQPDPNSQYTRVPNMAGDIEEVSTLLKLKKEVWKLHFDFFTAGGGLTSGSSQDPTITA